jgi:hypothetical protein
MMVHSHLTRELAKAHRQMLLEETERERLIAEYRRSEKTGSRGGLLEKVIHIHTNMSRAPSQAKG